jgi:site-specific DNA recombinase
MFFNRQPGESPDELADWARTRVAEYPREWLDRVPAVVFACLSEDIDQETFARKHTEMRDRLASIKLQLDAVDRSHDETAELAARVFELSQTLRQQWLTADYPEKRRLLEIVFLNSRLDGVTLVPTMRKPFDVLAEGLLSKNSRGDWIRTSGLMVPNHAL